MKYVKIETTENVGIATMNYRNENRLNPVFVDELLEALDEIEKNPEIRATVFTGGDPKFFCNGLDLEWIMANVSDRDKIIGYFNKLGELTRRLCLFPKPTVAALNGHAFAGGVLVAAYFDFRHMREDRGWVCVPEIDLNLPLPPSMIAILQAILPYRSFRDMYYLGKRYTGPEAVELGFVDGVFPAEELVAKSIELAAELGKKKTSTYEEYKKRIRMHIAYIIDEIDPKYHDQTIEFVMKSLQQA
ncbi:MAG: enoyl-CoA hydratase/isomerase family protein [bacterium]